MKRLIALLLALVMTFSLCACAAGGQDNTEPKDTTPLNIGFGKVNITPDYPVVLGAYTDENRFQQEVVEDVYATCIAVTSGEETVLVFTLDILWLLRETQQKMRASITAATGVPDGNIFFGGTHTHNAPDPEQSEQYKEDLTKWVAEAAKLAIADQAPATLQAAKHEVKGMNFIRHYQNQDGTYFGANFGMKVKPVSHVGEADSLLTLVKIEREEPKKDVLMINWQAHPDSGSDIGYYSISPSWIGPLRTTVTEATGMEVAYFTGAAGNLNKDSHIEEEEYGVKMGNIAVTLLDLLEPVEGTAIKTSRVIYDATVDHSWDDKLDQANEVYDLWKSTSKDNAKPLVDKYNFTSVYQSRAIRERAAMGETLGMELNAFCIGGIGFTTGTYEMFSENGRYVKDNSPFEYTIVMTGGFRYIPTKQTFQYRSYEGDCTYFVEGTGEALAEEYVKMLNSFK